MSKFPLFAAAGLIGAAAIPTQAAHAETMMFSEVEVEYSDLNLESERGRQILDRRIGLAAREVCGGNPRVRHLTEVLSFNRCTAAARESVRDARASAISGEGGSIMMAMAIPDRKVAKR